LEIGGYCGKSTAYIGAACKSAGSVLFSVDHHRGSEEHQPGELFFDPELYDWESGNVDSFPAFRRTIERAGIADHVIPMVCASALAARFWAVPLGLVFIDGGHSDAAAEGDYIAWAGHVAPGGFLAIHDIFENPAEGGQAPRRIHGMAVASRLFEPLPMTGTLGVLRRRFP
jgi:predicted O-methyltransferase YrrM